MARCCGVVEPEHGSRLATPAAAPRLGIAAPTISARNSAATAHTAMPSARPIAPRPSPRFGSHRDADARRPSARASAPSAATRLATIASTCGAERGCSAATTMSTLLDPPPELRRPARATSASSSIESASRRLLVARREQRAEIGQTGRAEHRVGDRVRDRVAVGVTDEPRRPVDRDATEHERRVVAERMHVEAETDPVLHAAVSRARTVEQRLRRARGRRPGSSSGCGARPRPRRRRHRSPRPARRRRCRPHRPGARRATRRRETPAASAPRPGPSRAHRLDHPIAVAPASPCRTPASAGTAPSAPSATACDHEIEEPARRERPRRVVHDHDVDVGGNHREPGAHRIGAGRATDRDAARRAGAVHAASAGSTTTTPSHASRADGDRPLDDARAAERRELLRAHRSARRPRPRRRSPRYARRQYGRWSGRSRRRYASSRRANTRRPALVGTTDVTCSITSGPPTRSLPPFTTTIEPSSR